jgi:hypothetical protein
MSTVPRSLLFMIAPHVFWSNDTFRHISAPPSCRWQACGWMAVDERGSFVEEGRVAGGAAPTADLASLPLGWFRIEFSPPDTNYTTVAILRPPDRAAVWPPHDTPVAVDTSQAWLQPPDLRTQSLVSRLAAAAGCGWVRDRLRWPDLEPQRGVYAPRQLSTVYDNATTAASRAGLRVLEVFHQTPVWALSPAADAGDGVRSTQTNMPRDLREVYTWCQWLARRFKGKVFAYEPWNGTVLVQYSAVVVCAVWRHSLRCVYAGLS